MAESDEVEVGSDVDLGGGGGDVRFGVKQWGILVRQALLGQKEGWVRGPLYRLHWGV